MADELQRVKNDIALRQAVIFVGTGVSLYTTHGEQEVSYWKGLLNHGFQQCHQSGYCGDEDFQYFNDQDKDDASKTWLMKTTRKLSAKNPELIEAIGELGCPILTTNYDSLLEDVLKRKPFTWNEYQHTGDALENQNNYILHMYGYFEKPDSVVFDADDYQQMHDDEVVQSKLRAILGARALLFIGYGAGMSSDLHFSHLLKWIHHLTDDKTTSIYKLVQSNEHNIFNQSSDASFLDNIKQIPYGNTPEDLVSFIRSLKSFTPTIRQSLLFTNKKEMIRRKYLTYLIQEYGHVSIFGHSNSSINLPLQSVYVELKFDPTQPSIKAMQTVEINEEFKRKLLSYGFFDESERNKIDRALQERNAFSSETIYRDFMIDQWLTVLLSNRTIFTELEATAIKNKIQQLKRSLMQKSSFQETTQYRIQQAYNELKHFIILGHPGSGKTTLAKWLVTNMAKQCLGEENMLFDRSCAIATKIPILIPIWKYVDQAKQTQHHGHKKSLLQFIYENPTFNSPFFDDEERRDLSSLMIESLIQGNVLVIFEGLDEVPAHVDRSELMKDINTLLERGTDYDVKSHQLIASVYEQKEINNIKEPNIGNRFIITSRIEGNYFEDINFYIPRLTIDNMSNEALRLFCTSYMQCIRDVSIKTGTTAKEYKTDQLYNDISANKDIFQLAINPQLAGVIAGLYTQYEGQLPEKRIDLYEKAIDTMVERLVTATSYASTELRLSYTMLWSILQEIAEYLHSKVEGLSERVLKEIIRRCLVQYEQNLASIDDFISELVNIFKYQAGLLTEFGHNSFRFIHRTFQEYLAAKSIVFSSGTKRSVEAIYENIISKIGIPNWRVPLSMTLGILSKLSNHNNLFDNLLTRLLTNEQAFANSQFSTLLMSFVIIDSLNDMYFPSKNRECQLIRNLADVLLNDYQNMSSFARLKEHQQLIQSYFFKLKQKYDETMTGWFIEKISHPQNLASCANVAYQLKWYKPQFHEVFLKNLHNDSAIWNWPIDSLLRFYSTKIKHGAVSTKLKCKNILQLNPRLVKHVVKKHDWLCLVTTLYGGYQNHNTPATIAEYYEIAQFLTLNNKERAPFTFYYQEVWGRDEPTYNMAVHLYTVVPTHLWNVTPVFDTNEMYKESFLTDKILQLLNKGKPAAKLIKKFRTQINSKTFSISDQIEALIGLVALGDFDFIHMIVKERDRTFIKSFANKLEQLISVLNDPIARCSSSINKYLLAIYDDMKKNQSKYHLSFIDYCRIYLSLIANSGGLPVDTKILAERMDNDESKDSLYAEYFASKLTGEFFHSDLKERITSLFGECIASRKSEQIIKSFLKAADALQFYRPVRGYSWSNDRFIFKSNDRKDIPIAFFNCVENIHTNIAFAVEIICEIFFQEGYFNQNSDLIPLVILLHFGIMFKGWKTLDISQKWLPELVDKTNMKEVLLDKIRSMSDPYYKSRALYQLAEFHDGRSYELLAASFILAKEIPQTPLRFQVLEKIFSMVHYKNVEQRLFIQQIVDELVVVLEGIEGLHDRVIASIRLSFYGSRQFRKKYLAHALKILIRMNGNDDQIKLIIKLQPLICLYDDLRLTLNQFVQSLKNKTHRYLAQSHYGRVLSVQKSSLDTLQPASNGDKQSEDYTQLQALFSLFAQLNDVRSMIGATETIDQLWVNLFKDPDSQSNVAKILEIGLKTELFLTPQAAIILDELVRQGKEECVSVLFPYIIKPSNEVLPVVQRWFTDYDDNKPIRSLAALLLVEAKHVFESAVDTIINLLQSDNDQLRYRAQRVFQHPERDVKQPSKRISVIGERTLIRILENMQLIEHPPRVRTYLNSFFYNLLWDDTEVFRNLYECAISSKAASSSGERRIRFFGRMMFINSETWNAMMRTLQSSSHPLYVEEILQSTMRLTQHDQITEDNWTDFARVLSTTDVSQFKERLYFTRPDVEIIQFILDEVCTLTDIVDETYFQILESQLSGTLTVPVEGLSRSGYAQIKHIGYCNFFTPNELNDTVLNMLNNSLLSSVILENLIQWLIQKMANFKSVEDTSYSFMLSDCLLSLVAACAQKDDYLYRKITNSPHFNKPQMTKLLEKMVHNHLFYPARGSAFILIAALDQTDHRVIVNAMNTLFDENLVKKYAMIAVRLIHLSPNELLDDLLVPLQSESAVKTYEILKIFTQFVLNEQIDADGKSKIIHYLANEIGQLKSKKPVNYYYTDIAIPFTTTLETELYKAWIKIQGLSGKTQYSPTSPTS